MIIVVSSEPPGLKIELVPDSGGPPPGPGLVAPPPPTVTSYIVPMLTLLKLKALPLIGAGLPIEALKPPAPPPPPYVCPTAPPPTTTK